MMPANLRGASWILTSGIVATVMSSGIHALGGSIHPFQITFVRCAIGLLLILPLIAPLGRTGLATRRLKLHVLRALIGVVAINAGYYCLTVLPLATVSVLFFTAPLFVVVFAIPLLREKVGPRRWSATLLGILGAGLVIGFNPTGFDPNMLVAIGSSVLFGLSLVLGKKLSATESPRVILFYFTVVTLCCSAGPAMLVWTPPDQTEMGLLVLVGVFATTRTYCDIRGYAAGEASFVAPFTYVRLAMMALAGYLWFGETPTANALLGAAVIILSTLYIAQREVRMRSAIGPILQQPDDVAASPPGSPPFDSQDDESQPPAPQPRSRV